MTLLEFIEWRLGQKNVIHDFSLGALLTYHKLAYLYEHDDRLMLDKHFVWFKPTEKQRKLFIYKQWDYPKATQVSSAFPLDLNLEFGSYKLKSKQEEVFYELGTLEKNYHSYRKPINVFEKRPDLGVELRDFPQDLAGLSALKGLHDQWVQFKLSLPTTHRISFPTGRYRNTLENWSIPMYRKAIYIKDKLYGFIVFSIENEIAFELSFCSLFWKPEFKILNGLNQYIFAYCAIQLQKQGVKFINSGYALNKNLKIFKHCSLKANKVFRYNYGV